jgi:hypothetical protein
MYPYGAITPKMVIIKKKTEIAVPLIDGSHTVERMPIAGYPHPVLSKYSMKRPVIEIQKLSVQR